MVTGDWVHEGEVYMLPYILLLIQISLAIPHELDFESRNLFIDRANLSTSFSSCI